MNNFKTMLPMLIHLANTSLGLDIGYDGWVALESTLDDEELQAWNDYVDAQYEGSN